MSILASEPDPHSPPRVLHLVEPALAKERAPEDLPWIVALVPKSYLKLCNALAVAGSRDLKGTFED